MLITDEKRKLTINYGKWNRKCSVQWFESQRLIEVERTVSKYTATVEETNKTDKALFVKEHGGDKLN